MRMELQTLRASFGVRVGSRRSTRRCAMRCCLRSKVLRLASVECGANTGSMERPPMSSRTCAALRPWLFSAAIASSTPPGWGRSLSLSRYSRRRRMRWTRSARLTLWNQVEKARTTSRASAGGRSRTRAASSACASRGPARPRMAATRSSSTSSNSCCPPCSRRISPMSAPSACTSSRSGSCLGGKWMSLRFTRVS